MEKQHILLLPATGVAQPSSAAGSRRVARREPVAAEVTRRIPERKWFKLPPPRLLRAAGRRPNSQARTPALPSLADTFNRALRWLTPPPVRCHSEAMHRQKNH